MSIEKQRNSIEFKVYGKYALFSDPITRVGGEKMTYLVPTYEAVKGIVSSIYWKPSIIWVVDAVRVMKRIKTESKAVKRLKLDKSEYDLSIFTYLSDVEYHVLAHFEWNKNYPELRQDWNENKHHNIAKRSVEKGGRRDIFLGTRECMGYVEPCGFEEENGEYDNSEEISFGVQFHGFDYPSESGGEMLSIRLWKNCVMKDGILKYPSPSCSELIRKDVRKMKQKKFVFSKNASLVAEDAVLTNSLVEE